MAFRRKRRDTKISTIEKQYDVVLGVPGDMTLGELLDHTGISSLSALLRAVRSPAASWQRAEQRACERRGLEHVGGPGKPDCRGDGKVVDVKHQQRPVNRSQVRRVASRPWARGTDVEMVSASGYTSGARHEAGRKGIKLSKR